MNIKNYVLLAELVLVAGIYFLEKYRSFGESVPKTILRYAL